MSIEKQEGDILDKLHEVEQEIVDAAKKVVKSASDPFSGVITFLHRQPENESLAGRVVDKALIESFGSKEEIPELIRAIACHIREVVRQADVIRITNDRVTAEKWGKFVIKKKEELKFEIDREKECLVLKNIKGLFGIEHGVEMPLEKILVKPPKLIVTAKMGLIRPQKVLDIV